MYVIIIMFWNSNGINAQQLPPIKNQSDWSRTKGQTVNSNSVKEKSREGVTDKTIMQFNPDTISLLQDLVNNT